MLYVISIKLKKTISSVQFSVAQSKAESGWSDIWAVEPGDSRTQEEWAFLTWPAGGSVC